ncbi:MAG: hypothetical protein ACPGVY_08035, partial [Mycobacterium sp.]
TGATARDDGAEGICADAEGICGAVADAGDTAAGGCGAEVHCTSTAAAAVTTARTAIGFPESADLR